MALATAVAPAPAPAAMPIAEPAPAVGRPHPRPRSTRPSRPKVGPVGRSHHPASAVTPARLTRRGVALCWTLAVLVTVGIAFGLLHGMQPSTPRVVGTQSVTVHSGESLWALAQQVNPAIDARVTVAAIRDANGLGPVSIVQPGTTLAVPVYEPAR